MKNKICNLCLFFLPGILLVMVSCTGTKHYQAYKGDAKEPDQIAAVIIPVYLELLSVDGDRVGPATDLFRGNKLAIEVLPGQHTFRVRYKDIWEVTPDYDYEKVESNPFDLTFAAEAGRQYEIAGKDPQDLSEAKDYAAHFHVWLVDENGNKVITAPETPPSGGEKAVSHPGPGEKESMDIAQKDVPPPSSPGAENTPVKEEKPGARVTKEEAAMAGMEPSSGVSTLDLLKFLWPKTNEKDRQVFLAWIEETSPVVPDIQKTTEVSALDLLKFWWDKAGDEERRRFLAWTKEQ